jgi:hypothetical protein
MVSISTQPISLRARIPRKQRRYQIVDHVEAIVSRVLGVDLEVLLLPHVLLENGMVLERLLTIDALDAVNGRTDERRRHSKMTRTCRKLAGG